METIQITSSEREKMISITTLVQNTIPKGFTGIIQIYVPHTTSAIIVNEGADPNVQVDVLAFLGKLVPWDQTYFKHAEGNSAAHIKAMLIGNSVSVIVNDEKLQLGRWESIFFCEFDGPRTRNVWVMFTSELIL